MTPRTQAVAAAAMLTVAATLFGASDAAAEDAAAEDAAAEDAAAEDAAAEDAAAEDAAASPQTVPASVLSIAPADYDGQRILTSFSLGPPLSGHSKAYGCDKHDVVFFLGAVQDPAKPAGMLRGAFFLCANGDLARDLVQLAFGTTLDLSAEVGVKGPKASPRITLTDTQILSVTAVDLSAQWPGAAAPQP